MPRNLCSVFVAITLLVHCSSISVLWLIVGRDRVAHETFEISMRLNSQNGCEFGWRQNIFLLLDSLSRSKPPWPSRTANLVCGWFLKTGIVQNTLKAKEKCWYLYVWCCWWCVEAALVSPLFSWFFSLQLNSFFFALFQQCEVMLQKPLSGSGLNLDFIFSKTLVAIAFEVWGFQWPKTSLPMRCFEVSRCLIRCCITCQAAEHTSTNSVHVKTENKSPDLPAGEEAEGFGLPGLWVGSSWSCSAEHRNFTSSHGALGKESGWVGVGAATWVKQQGLIVPVPICQSWEDKVELNVPCEVLSMLRKWES